MGHRSVLSFARPAPEFITEAFAELPRKGRAIEERRLDLFIDGQPLRNYWRDREQAEVGELLELPTLVTRLSSSTRREALRQLGELEVPASGASANRVELLYCPICFSLEDGILSVEIRRENDTVWWRKFGWKDEFQDGDPDALVPMDDIAFDPEEYDLAICGAREQFVTGRGFWRR